MPFLESSLFVITMACTTKQQSIPLMDTTEPIKCEEKRVFVSTEVYDEESRKYRKHMAQQEALRQLERTKTRVLAAAHKMSFIR